MAFCTLLEWDEAFPFDRYRQMNDQAQGHTALPEGCLSRIAGRAGSGAAIIEIWRSAEDARRFSEQHAHLLAEFAMPPPTRTTAFETAIYQIR